MATTLFPMMSYESLSGQLGILSMPSSSVLDVPSSQVPSPCPHHDLPHLWTSAGQAYEDAAH